MDFCSLTKADAFICSLREKTRILENLFFIKTLSCVKRFDTPCLLNLNNLISPECT